MYLAQSRGLQGAVFVHKAGGRIDTRQIGVKTGAADAVLTPHVKATRCLPETAAADALPARF
jgi:hypothetical protein